MLNLTLGPKRLATHCPPYDVFICLSGTSRQSLVGGLTREPPHGGGGGLAAFLVCFKYDFSTGAFPEEEEEPVPGGLLGETRGEHAWERSEPRPLQNLFWSEQEGFGSQPEGFAPRKSGAWASRDIIPWITTFSNINNNGGANQARSPSSAAAARALGQPGGRCRPRDRGCRRAAAPDTRPAALAARRSVVTAAPGAPEPLGSWMSLYVQLSLHMIRRKRYDVFYTFQIFIQFKYVCACRHVKLMQRNVAVSAFFSLHTRRVRCGAPGTVRPVPAACTHPLRPRLSQV